MGVGGNQWFRVEALIRKNESIKKGRTGEASPAGRMWHK
jgi:hypothetical protein